MIKKMSLFGISFAFLGLAFICESANAGKQICREKSAYAKPSSHATEKPSATSSFCVNPTGLRGSVWYCETGYYYDGSSCVELPGGAHEDLKGTGAQVGFECGDPQYFINSPAPGCAALPSPASAHNANGRRSVDNKPGYL